MSKYIAKVLPTEECNPDFVTDEALREGIEGDAFMLVMFEDGKPVAEAISGLTVRNLADWIRGRTQAVQVVRQASAIAEGQIRAMEILTETEEGENTIMSMTGKLAKKLTKDEIRAIFGIKKTDREGSEK